MATTSIFQPSVGSLLTLGDGSDNTIEIGRNAAGTLRVNGGAVPILGGTPTVANASLLQVFGQGGNDTVTLNEALGALPRGLLFGGSGNDLLTGGSGDDQIFGGADSDTLFGKGGQDLLFGGSGNDVLTGGDGDDEMFGGGGDDRLIWNPGDDTDLFEGGSGLDTAEVNGGNGTEVFSITANGTRLRIDRLDPAPFSIDAGTIEKIVINANGGNDVMSVTGNVAALAQITLDGGAGNDTIGGGNGADLLLGGDGDDVVDGNQGADTGLLGAGDDRFIWDPGDGSDVVEGQAGTDTLVFNGSNAGENFGISANGGRVLMVRDIANITMDLNDVETIQLRALGSADNVVVGDLGGTDLTRVEIDLAASGGGGDAQVDTVTVNGTGGDDVIIVTRSGGTVTVAGLAADILIFNFDATDRLVINGLGGDDVVEASGLSAGGVLLQADGGEGDDILIGGDGADVLNGDAGDDVLLGGPGLDGLNGGAGDNIVIQG
jgi:Ca2+-binding RTX toxin-like protein